METLRDETVETEPFAPLPGETWAQLTPNYLLSNLGRWFSISRGKLLKQRPNSNGYMRVYAIMDGKKDIFTHIKVVEAFGDRKGKRVPYGGSLVEHGLSIDHIDGNKLNNTQSNLEIVTHIENCARRDQRRAVLVTSYVQPDANIDVM